MSNCKEVSGLIFLVGVGYEKEGEWIYKKFLLENAEIEEEKDMINNFIGFIESLVSEYMEKIILKVDHYVILEYFIGVMLN